MIAHTQTQTDRQTDTHTHLHYIVSRAFDNNKRLQIADICIRNCVQLLPLYVMDQIHYPGFPGLFTACIFSGALR